jgi:hypothetical protein
MRIMLVAAALSLGAVATLARSAPPREMGRGAPAPPTADGMEGFAVDGTIPDHSTPTGKISVTVPSLDVLGGWVSKNQAAALRDKLPLTLQLPVSDAANACGVEARLLAKGVGSCTANNGSRALAESVIKQMMEQ